jgi:hypothetical protein
MSNAPGDQAVAPTSRSSPKQLEQKDMVQNTNNAKLKSIEESVVKLVQATKAGQTEREKILKNTQNAIIAKKMEGQQVPTQLSNNAIITEFNDLNNLEGTLEKTSGKLGKDKNGNQIMLAKDGKTCYVIREINGKKYRVLVDPNGVVILDSDGNLIIVDENGKHIGTHDGGDNVKINEDGNDDANVDANKLFLKNKDNETDIEKPDKSNDIDVTLVLNNVDENLKSLNNFTAKLKEVSEKLLKQLTATTENKTYRGSDEYKSALPRPSLKGMRHRVNATRRSDMLYDLARGMRGGGSKMEEIPHTLDFFYETNMKFLKEQKFAGKLQFLWTNARDRTSNAVSVLFNNVIDPFYAKVQTEARKSTTPDTQYLYDDVNKKLVSQRKQLHDMWHGRVTAANIAGSPTGMIYMLKFARLLVILGSLNLASKSFQTRYVTRVFVDNSNPPSLYFFMFTYLAIELVFMLLIFAIVYLLRNVLSVHSIFPITDQIFKNFVADYVISTIIIAIIGLLLCHIVMKKKYFRYKIDGLRAIRSLEEMLFHVASVVLVFPYYIMNPYL